MSTRPEPDLFRAPAGPMPAGPTIATETWIARRLLRSDLFAGLTDPADRRERVRHALLADRLGPAIAGKREGNSCETWSELFERVYHQPLITRPKGGPDDRP